MKQKVVMQFELRFGLGDQIREMADVIIDPKLEQVEGADVIVVGGGPADGDLMDRAGPNLKLITKPGIGVDNCDIEAATQRNIMIGHTPDAPTESTAEHAVALIMAVAKRVMVGDMYLRGDKEIERGDMLGTELLGRTLGVIGYGRIGRRVAEICASGIKMNVVVYDPFISSDADAPERVSFVTDLDELLRQARFLTVHVPLMPATRHLIGEREMRLMPEGAYLVNASRGPVIDEAALIRVLQDGHLAAAGLDVFDPEPPEPDNPLLKMKNVVVTPHIASGTDRGHRAMQEGTQQQVLKLLRGERPTWLVNGDVWPGRVKTS